MRLTIRPAALFTMTLVALLGLTVRAQAQVVYSDTFDSGASQGTASAYFSDATQNNGLLFKSEDLYTTGGIGSDVSGSGFFLFEGTNNQTVPVGQSAFYISPTFAVTQNTLYNVSFFLTNDNTNNSVAQVQTVINGTALGSTVSAVGTYTTNGYQQFTFTFNSGTATSATLTLNDLQTNSSGNDFGVDNIRVVAVPEPGSMALLVGMGLTGTGFLVRRKRREHSA